MSESILEEAQRLIHGERNQNYGHPRENFKNIARLFSGYLDREISDIDVANLMILVKVARVQGGPYHRDSFTDIAGYAGCVGRIYEEDTPVDVALAKITEEMDQNRKEALWNPPRVWPYIDNVPLDVVVEASDGDGGEGNTRYKMTGGGLRVFMGGDWVESLYNPNPSDLNKYGPFTEVV